jgi:hypothetical protein
MIPVILFAIIVGQISISLIWAHVRTYRLSTFNWEQLEAKLEPVGLQGIQIAAADHSARPGIDGGTESNDLWDLLGGLAGMRRLESNARIMIALAGYMERQNNLENMILAERMRHDGAVVRKTIRSIRITCFVRTRTEILHTQMHEAAKAYDAMKKRLPALYEMSHRTSYAEPLGA